MAEASSVDQDGSEKSKNSKKNPTFQIGASLYMKEHLSDMKITLLVNGTVWRFPVHSIILAAQNEVFEKIVLGDIEQKTREIRFQDMSPKTLKKLIRYMYLGDASIEVWEEALDLLKVAHKYRMETLVQVCSQYLKHHVDLSNVCHMYMMTAELNLIDLRDFYLEVILSTACIVLRSDSFEDLNEESVIDVISSSSLNVDSETCVVTAVLRWATAQCCRQNKSLTEDNMAPLLIPFFKYLNIENINRDELVTLPQFMQVNKNVFSRQNFRVSHHLLYHAKYVNFKIMDNISNYKKYDYENEYNVKSGVTILLFHVVYPLFLIGINLISVGSLYDDDCITLLTKVDGVTTPVFKCYVKECVKRINKGVCGTQLFKRYVMFDMPVHLQPNTAYHIRFGIIDNSFFKKPVLFPETETDLIQIDRVGYTDSTPFTIDADSFWGVTKLLYLITPVKEI